MIQQSELTFWQSRAPWPKRSQIEQDLRLARGVAAIFSDPLLHDHLAMRGGTVLHKAHLAPAARYSEDIDLVLVKHLPPDDLERHLLRVLEPVLGRPSKSIFTNAWLAVRNLAKPSKIMRIEFRFVPLMLQYEETIKVEINLNENGYLYPLVEVAFDTLDEDGDLQRAMARSYDINEMLGTKTRALMQREQGRDLFDLVHALELSKAGRTPYSVDCRKVIDAFNWYLDQEGTAIDAKEANALLDKRLRSEAFRRDMETLLRPGLPRFDVDAGATIVREGYFSHLRQ